jgi:hypothetical protein
MMYPTLKSCSSACCLPLRKVERKVKFLIKHLAISFYFPARSFCQYYSNFSCWKLLPKHRRNKDKSSKLSLFSDAFSLPVHFEFFAIFSYCLHFAKFVCLLQRLQEWLKSPAGTRQTYGKNRFGLEK